MVSIGILGCGRIGQVHARSIARMDNARLTAVADALPVHEGESSHRASRDGGRLRLGKDRVLVDEGKELAARTVFHYYVVDAIDAAVVKECAEVGVAGGGDDPRRLKLWRRPATSARGGAG